MSNPSPPAASAAPRIRLRTDLARLDSFRYSAIQLETGGPRTWVVATHDETRLGAIRDDGRPRYPSLHAAFDAAHRRAVSERRLRPAA